MVANVPLIAVKVDLQAAVQIENRNQNDKIDPSTGAPRLAADLTGQCGLLALPFLVAT
jgi:hypothetical protein